MKDGGAGYVFEIKILVQNIINKKGFTISDRCIKVIY